MENIIIFLSNDGYDRGFFCNIAMFLPEEWKGGGFDMRVFGDKYFEKNLKENGWEKENVIIFCFDDHEKSYPHHTIKIDRGMGTISLSFFEENIKRLVNNE
jgi:hypothetical protein